MSGDHDQMPSLPGRRRRQMPGVCPGRRDVLKKNVILQGNYKEHESPDFDYVRFPKVQIYVWRNILHTLREPGHH